MYRQQHRLNEHDKQRSDSQAEATGPILKKGAGADDDGLRAARQDEVDKAQDRKDKAGAERAEQDRRDARKGKSAEGEGEGGLKGVNGTEEKGGR